jgi:hypothetical protein
MTQAGKENSRVIQTWSIAANDSKNLKIYIFLCKKFIQILSCKVLWDHFELSGCDQATAPWQCLYFCPDPQGHSAFRLIPIPP